MKILEAIKARAEKAEVELNRTCADNFLMRIHVPPKSDDTDLVIGDALADNLRLTRALESALSHLYAAGASAHISRVEEILKGEV